MKKKWLCAVAAIVMLSMTACRESNTNPAEQDAQSVGENSTARTNSLSRLRDAVVKVLGGNYWPGAEISQHELEQTYGITADLYDTYFGEKSVSSTDADVLLIIRAKEGKVAEVEEALNAYRDVLTGSAVQYPMNVSKIQASRIEVIDNYVCFVQLGADVTGAMSISEEAAIEHCLAENERAIDALQKAIEE